MSSIKKFIGEQAYKQIENCAYSADAIRAALVTPQNARAVFADLTEYETRSLVADISNSGTIGKVRHTTQEEIKTAFAEAGYSTVIFDDEQAVRECAKYYRDGERICTYNNLKNRMNEYHMLVAIKQNIDKIERAENPQREDEYGTSIINIQIARNGSHMSIKNRYNHTVAQCDSTFDNDLNHIKMGLQNMVLGYYGFAGLERQNRRYNNVVNIGGVYLKYHTERDNVYFGAFTLDGTNGARYTDAGRYCVTKGAGDRDRLPLVLDFHKKEAVDLTGRNGKAPLVSRAMREGLLHSGNKEQADTMSAIFPDGKKELLQANRKALKYAAEIFGYDFQQPYKVTGILGNFTAKSIEKATGSANALLLMPDGGNMRVARLNGGKFEIKDIKGKWSYGISEYYHKGSFEEMRKSGNAAAYVIQQDKQYRREVKKESGDLHVYIGNGMRRFSEMTDAERARYELGQRLIAYKAKKRKAEAQSMNYTEEITMIDGEFANLKAELVARLVNANAYEEYDALTDVINYRLAWLVRDIARLKATATAKGFASVQQAQDSINSIKTAIAKMWRHVNK